MTCSSFCKDLTNRNPIQSKASKRLTSQPHHQQPHPPIFPSSHSNGTKKIARASDHTTVDHRKMLALSKEFPNKSCRRFISTTRHRLHRHHRIIHPTIQSYPMRTIQMLATPTPQYQNQMSSIRPMCAIHWTARRICSVTTAAMKV